MQERAAAKITHSMDGFVHKAFSIAYATSFDEVGHADIQGSCDSLRNS